VVVLGAAVELSTDLQMDVDSLSFNRAPEEMAVGRSPFIQADRVAISCTPAEAISGGKRVAVESTSHRKRASRQNSSSTFCKDEAVDRTNSSGARLNKTPMD